MSSCIWNTPVEDRHCEFCTYKDCESRQLIRTVAASYIDIMEKLVGKDILSPTRRSLKVWARFIVAYQLFRDGYSYKEIGKALGRDRTTIYYAVKSVKNMLLYPKSYSEEFRIWMRFQKLLSLQKNIAL